MDLRNFLGAVERDFANPSVDEEEKVIFIPDDYSELDSPILQKRLTMTRPSKVIIRFDRS